MASNIASLNICGLVSLIKQQQVTRFLNQQQFDILFLQETNITLEHLKTNTIKHNNYRIFYNCGDSRGTGLVSFFSNFLPIPKHNIVYPGFVSSFEFKSFNKKYVLVNTYVPNDQSLARDVLLVLKTHLLSFNNDIIIICGDFNCTLSPEIDRSSGNESHRTAMHNLSSIVINYQLIDIFRHKNPQTVQYSKYTNNRQALHGSRLDRFYISSHVIQDVKNITYEPVTFSDHFSVKLTYNFTTNRTAYWIFKNTLLNNVSFSENLKSFWLSWRSRKLDFDSLASWWEIGKAHIKAFILENYSKPKYPSGSLTQEFNYIANHLPLNPELYNYFQLLKNKIQSRQRLFSLENIAQSQVKNLEDSSKPTKNFFQNMMDRKQTIELDQIQLQTGEILTGSILESYLREYYQEQFAPNNTSNESDAFFNEIPKLNENDKLSLEDQYTFAEFKLSTETMARNTAPGMDGLTPEFYNHFKSLIVPDLLEVFNSTHINNEPFPSSWTTQVLKLIPKTGNNKDINNWRAISLCNADYKIIMKSIANRLKVVIGTVVDIDQSYCIPGRTIYDNVMVAKYIFDYHDKMNLPLGMLTLDQSKAFDNVAHSYLFVTLRQMNFPNSFIQIIKNLYNDSKIIIKHKGKLLSPVPFLKGIRQGCPLSGMLYSIVIETFLHNLRKNMINCSLQLPHTNKSLTTLAYADDIMIFVVSESAFEHINFTIEQYGVYSGAKINFNKSKGLWVGCWKGRQDMPLGVAWKSDSVRYLGLSIGIGDINLNNQSIMSKLTRVLGAWNLRIRNLSLRGRVIILNYIIASSIYHILKCHVPEAPILKAIQERILTAFWSGRRWLAEPVLYQNVCEGGIALVHIPSKSHSSQCKLFTDLSIKNNLYTSIYQPLLKLYDPRANNNFSFILMKSPFPNDWSLIIQKIASNWSIYRTEFIFTPSKLSIQSISSLPLWKNPDVRDNVTGEILNLPLYNFTCAIYGDVADDAGVPKIPMVDIGARALHSIVQTSYISANEQSTLTPLESLTNKNELSQNAFNMTTVDFYRLTLKKDKPAIFHWKEKWKPFFRENLEIIKPNIKMYYSKPAISTDSDIAFRLLHHSLPHPNQISHFTPDGVRTCNVCKANDGTLYHRFFSCPVLKEIRSLSFSIIRKIDPNIELSDYFVLIGPKVKSTKNSLISYILTTSKATIHQFFCDSSLIHSNTAQAALILKRSLLIKLKKRIHLEQVARTEESFNIAWNNVAKTQNKILSFNF